MQTINRAAFIEKAAEVSAQCLYDVHEGRGDTSMVEVDGKMKMKPFLPLIAQIVGKPEGRITSISDGVGGVIELSVTEEEDLENRTNFHLVQLVRKTIQDAGRDSPEAVFEAGKRLVERATRAGSVLLIGMNTAKQKKVSQSKDFVIVAPYNGKGQTLMTPEPSTTGQRYVG
jgi:hypothetical protein